MSGRNRILEGLPPLYDYGGTEVDDQNSDSNIESRFCFYSRPLTTGSLTSKYFTSTTGTYGPGGPTASHLKLFNVPEPRFEFRFLVQNIPLSPLT
jgi:hypothetical protein